MKDRAYSNHPLCEKGIHSWADEVGVLPPATPCDRCGETYGEVYGEKGGAPPIAFPEARKICVVSTAHLSGDLARWLDETPTGNDVPSDPKVCWPVSGGSTTYGWLVFVHTPDHMAELVEKDPTWASLETVLDAARHAGFDYVLFDRDARAVEGLPVYDW